MKAAANCSVTLVKVFVDVPYADDALIAPEGLRLAAERGLREIMDSLPSRGSEAGIHRRQIMQVWSIV